MTSVQPACIVSNHDVGNTTYYGIGGVARYYCQPHSLLELRQSLGWARQQRLPVAVLGCGSNALVSDGQLNALIICLSELKTCYWENDQTLYAEAGVSNTEIAEVCLDAGRDGASWMYRMPGHLGATVRMNARCFGGEISQIASEIFTIDTRGQLRVRAGSDVFHGYKKTLLMDAPEIVLAARLTLPTQAPREDILGHMLECENERLKKHHFDYPSCGSTFKNNYAVGRPSGHVFDACGLKGTTIGQSQVSEFHANFVWNLGGTSAYNMLTLAAHMRECALTQQQADLELEVQPIGLFDETLFSACAMSRLGPSVADERQRWVGLLWHPRQEEQPEDQRQPPTQSAALEALLFEAPYLHYSRMPGAGCPDLVGRLVQLTTLAEAEQQPDRPFLRWDTAQKKPEQNWQQLFPLSPTTPAGFVDELWNFSVSEVFFASGKENDTHYMEFECTPAGHWVALAFDAPRRRTPEHLSPRAELWPGVAVICRPDQLSLTFSYATLAPLIHAGHIKMQGCLSLGNNALHLAPHWAPSGNTECWDTQDRPDVKPDFHQPHRFWDIDLW